VHKNDLRPLVDVNTLPRFDRELYFEKYPELKNAPTKKIFVVRGCPYNCTYCFNAAFKKMYAGKGRYVRHVAVDKIIDEIKYLKETYGMRWLQINGDTVNVDREWFMDLLDRYRQEVDVPFLCNVRIDRIDEEMVQKMKEAQCDRVDYGIESGDEHIRRDVFKRDMSNEQIVNSGKLFNKYKIRVQTANIIGSPHETVDSVMKTIEVNRQVRPELAKCFVLQPYPRTEIHSYSVDQGFLESNYDFSHVGTGFQIDFDGSNGSIPLKLDQRKELINLFYFFDVLVKYKWLEPLVKKMIALPPNRFFKFVYVFPVVKQDIKYGKSFKRAIKALAGIIKILMPNGSQQ